MVEFQIVNRGINSRRILRAFYDVPREFFVPVRIQDYAYFDGPLDIGFGATISQPYVVAIMTYMLDPKPDETILEIGTGSGYQSAILSKLCLQVESVEIIPELANFSRQNLRKADINNVDVMCYDGTLSLEKEGFFDKIVVTCATLDIPEDWITQIKEGGFIVLPQGDINSQILKKYKKIKGKLKLVQEGLSVKFLPLHGQKGLM